MRLSLFPCFITMLLLCQSPATAKTWTRKGYYVDIGSSVYGTPLNIQASYNQALGRGFEARVGGLLLNYKARLTPADYVHSQNFVDRSPGPDYPMDKYLNGNLGLSYWFFHKKNNKLRVLARAEFMLGRTNAAYNFIPTFSNQGATHNYQSQNFINAGINLSTSIQVVPVKNFGCHVTCFWFYTPMMQGLGLNCGIQLGRVRTRASQ